MRIAIVTGIFPPDIGGPATYAPLIASVLERRGHQVEIATTADRSSLRHEPPAVGSVRVSRIPRRPASVRTLRLIRTVATQAAWADVVYAVGMHLEAAVATSIARRPFIAKVVGDFAWERARGRGWTRQGFDEFQTSTQPARVEMLKRLRSWSLRQAEAIIVPSEYLARTVVAWGVAPERCRVVYNAVPKGGLGGGWPLRSAGEPLRIVTVCRLVPWKGVDVLIRALAALPDARLSVVGDGPARSDLEALGRDLGVADRVCFHGTIPPDVLREEMRRHHVFALASTYEGLPHVVLEAMEEGLAVVATRAGGTPEVVRDGETGLLTEPGAPPMADAIRRLTAEPSLGGRLVAGARAMLSERFDERVMIEQTEAVLRSVVAARRANGPMLRRVESAS